MQNKDWLLLDTETTGLTEPIMVVELAAQRMRGWVPHGDSFRRILNQNANIPPEASRVHGYTREILERDGEPVLEVYRRFADYVGDLPIVAYNSQYDIEEVLKPEWRRLGIQSFGAPGFCALRLAHRLLDPVPAGNCKLQTLRQYYRLPERGAHTALGDVMTVADLMSQVLRPIAGNRGLESWTDIQAFAGAEWFPSRIAFGKFKGRDYRDARNDETLRRWLSWLAGSSNASTAQMAKWYLSHLEDLEPTSDGDFPIDAVVAASETTDSTAAAAGARSGIVLYVHVEVEQLRQLIAASRSRLADLEAVYTKDRRGIETTQATIFNLVRGHYQSRDRLKLIVDYRQKYLKTLLQEGEEEAGRLDAEFENARAQSDANYDQAAAAAANKNELTEKEESELKALWKKLVRLYHPDSFANQTDKIETYEKLTSAINRAKEDGDIDLLREIASDPASFILRQRWTMLDFGEEIEVVSMRKLYATLQIEIVSVLDSLNRLHESSDFELHTLSENQPGMLREVANDQIRTLTTEIVELESEAARLKAAIDELASSGPRP